MQQTKKYKNPSEMLLDIRRWADGVEDGSVPPERAKHLATFAVAARGLYESHVRDRAVNVAEHAQGLPGHKVPVLFEDEDDAALPAVTGETRRLKRAAE